LDGHLATRAMKLPPIGVGNKRRKMPVFECDRCGCIENTATSNYWSRDFLHEGENYPALCSECDPEIGKWHGEFKKELAKDKGLWVGEDGFLYDPEFPPHHTKLIRACGEKEKE